MNHELLENNKVYLQGEVVDLPVYSHEVLNEGFYTLNISIPRLSGQNDIIPVTISERLLKSSNMVIGQTVALKGQFRSYNKIDEGKSKLVLTVFVRELCEVDESINPNIIEIFGYICKEPIYRTTHVIEFALPFPALYQ